MKEREKIVATSLLVLLLVAWAGFLVHRAPRFAGSAWGGAFAVTGAVLMLVPLFYSAIKRIPWLKRVCTRRVRMRTWLAIHVYAGLLGPLFVLIHTGHKFNSPLGVLLTALTLIVVVSGFVGRYLMGKVGSELREKRQQLATAQASFDAMASQLATEPELQERLTRWGVLKRTAATFLLQDDSVSQAPPQLRALQLAETVSDLEHAIQTHEFFKAAFGAWLRLHIVLSVGLYVLLALHVWAAIHFGLRWFA